MTLKTKLAPVLAFSLLAALFAGCSSGPANTDADGDKSPDYIDDKTLEAFDTDLRDLAASIQRADTSGESSMRAKISESARIYQKALISALYDDSSTPRRALAGVMLGFTGDSAVVPMLMEIVANPDEPESVRLNSVLGLTTLGDKLRDYKNHSELMLLLSDCMSDTESSFQMRRACVQAFAVAYDGALNDSIVPLRNRFVSDASPNVQIAAVNAMGDIGDLAAVLDLTTIGLRHPAPEIRAASAIALGKIQDPNRVLPALSEACADESVQVRRQAIDAISKHYGSDPELVYSTVLTGLADFDDRVRESAALALARIKDQRAIEPLLQATGDRVAVVREAAARSLGDLVPAEREKEIFPLVELLSDQNPGVQIASLQSLTRVTRTDMGNDQSRWRKFFYTKYPELDPSKLYDGKAKPRFSSGISNSGTRSRTTSSQPRTNNNNRNTNSRTNTRNTNTRNTNTRTNNNRR